MDKQEKIEAFYAKAHPFRDGINQLRELALKTRAEERLKWGAPVYTLENKNVFGIMRFKTHFGLWFFNGVFLSDPKNVLEAGEDTKAMRHWRFHAADEIDAASVLAYMEEALENQAKGVALKPQREKETVIPQLLTEAMEKDADLRAKFEAFTPYKQREFCEHISGAKQERTRENRLRKCIPMIKQGIGLNDKYRK